MAIALPRKLVEVIILGPANDRRQLQDSPILGDVWVRFATHPDEPQELLITPHREKTAGEVAVAIDELVNRGPSQEPLSEIAPLHTVVAARLYFREVLTVVIPFTRWWHDKQVQADLNELLHKKKGEARLSRVIDAVLAVAASW